MSPLQKIEADENEDDIEMISETLIHGYGETNLIDDLSNKIIEIAPSKHFIPLGIFQDKYSEELNFPTLFLDLIDQRTFLIASPINI